MIPRGTFRGRNRHQHFETRFRYARMHEEDEMEEIKVEFVFEI